MLLGVYIGPCGTLQDITVVISLMITLLLKSCLAAPPKNRRPVLECLGLCVASWAGKGSIEIY